MPKNEFALAFNEVLEEKQLSKEIILSAGAFFSPKLLLQSGIGPAAELKSVASGSIPLACSRVAKSR